MIDSQSPPPSQVLILNTSTTPSGVRNPESSAQKVSATQKVCATCGNSYARTFAIVQEGKTYYFDCFECAIQALAPRCARCGCRIIGHGAEEGERIFCCAHCARQEGVLLVCDHC